MIARGTKLLLPCLACLLLAQCAQKHSWQNGWRETNAMTHARSGFAWVAHNNHLYVLGGVDGRRYLESTEFAPIRPDGSLGSWRTGQPLQQPRGFFAAVAANGYIYAIGGGRGDHGEDLITTVERAAVAADGSLGPWQELTQRLNLPRRCARVFREGDRIVATGGFGGASLDNSEAASLGADGQLGPWRLQTQKLTQPRYVHAVASAGHYQFVIGGHQQSKGAGLTTVEWRQTGNPSGDQPWRATTSLAYGRYGLAATAIGQRVYALGGMDGVSYMDHIEMAPVREHGLGKWRRLQTTLPMALAEFGVLVHGRHIYVIGGTHQHGYSKRIFFTGYNGNGELGFSGPASQVARVEKSTAAKLPYGGVVEQVLPSSSYVYLQLKNGEDRWWIATQGTFHKGQLVQHGQGVPMKDFYSKGLKRTFKQIIFTGRYKIIEP